MYFLSLTPSWHQHANEQNSFKCRQFLPHLARQNKQRRRSYVCCLILYYLLCVEHIERRVQVELCTRCGQGDEQTCKMSWIFLQTCLALRGRRGRSKDWNFEEKCFEIKLLYWKCVQDWLYIQCTCPQSSPRNVTHLRPNLSCVSSDRLNDGQIDHCDSHHPVLCYNESLHTRLTRGHQMRSEYPFIFTPVGQISKL